MGPEAAVFWVVSNASLTELKQLSGTSKQTLLFSKQNVILIANLQCWSSRWIDSRSGLMIFADSSSNDSYDKCIKKV